jgi:hypothetical protein
VKSNEFITKISTAEDGITILTLKKVLKLIVSLFISLCSHMSKLLLACSLINEIT